MLALLALGAFLASVFTSRVAADYQSPYINSFWATPRPVALEWPSGFVTALSMPSTASVGQKTAPDGSYYAQSDMDGYLASVAGSAVHDLALAREIIRRESGWHWWKCNETTPDGCGAGQGLFMVIPGTERSCEKALGRQLDMLNPYDNTDCGWWLLTNKGVLKGIGNWDSFGQLHNGKKWGSGPYDLKSFGITGSAPM